MSPTVFRDGKYRFFFFSREESRMHVHITSPDGEAKFWMEPEIALCEAVGLKAHEVKRLEKIVKEHSLEIRKSWESHFPRN